MAIRSRVQLSEIHVQHNNPELPFSVAVMATRSRVQLSEIHVQHNNPEQQQEQNSGWSSWLFGGWRSKDSHEETSSNFCEAHTTVQLSAKVGEFHAADSGELSHEAKVSHGVKPAAGDFEVESVDKEAEDFIEGMKRKLEAERLKSIKRMEGMLNRDH